ncbi:MAG TPA: ABC transporter permease [Candidatus Binatia bacterium]|nr:ABC transporter permease [Candidatus Binatia bacterium]
MSGLSRVAGDPPEGIGPELGAVHPRIPPRLPGGATPSTSARLVGRGFDRAVRGAVGSAVRGAVGSAVRGGIGSAVRRFAPAVLGLGLAGLLWWAVFELFVEEGSLLARFGPIDAVATLARLLEDGTLVAHGAASLRRIVAGLALAAAVGIPLGLALGASRLAGAAAGPALGLVRMISPLSWTPIAIIVFGVGDAPVVFLVAIGAVWPIVLNTASGVAHLDPAWLRVARSLGANRLETLRHIVWPGIRPNVLTGLRLATGLAWVVLVPGEMLGVDSGLGYRILDARDRFAYDELVATILVIGLLGLGIDLVARRVFATRRPA